MFIIGSTLIVTILAGIYAYSKTPIYEAKALIEIGDYKTNQKTENSNQIVKVTLDNALELQKKLSTLFIDMLKNDKERTKEVTNISVSKGSTNFLEIKSEAQSNEDAKKEIEEVVIFIQAEHSRILDDVKKQKELELNNIFLQISDIKSKSVLVIDKKVNANEQVLKDLNEQLKLVDENLKSIQSLNPSLAALKLMEKRDITNSISELNIQLFELENKKDELLTTTIYKLEEEKRNLESLLLSHNYKNTQVVGEIILNDHPVKPKKSLIVVVAFVTGFILSIFLVFFLQFVQSMRKESK